jgi:heme ABC exporter ATP-binding subunit CcmA
MKTLYLQIQGLKKSYTLKPILRGIDLDLYRGERVALLGANGTGKTTLLRILAGLTKPSAGTICTGGLDIVHDAQRVRHLVGFVAHQPYLYDELTAMENLLFFGRMYAVKQVHERAAELLNRVGLARRAQERVSTLSRGQVQRLSLARALLHSPQLLLLDEPDTGLDEEGNELLADILYEHTEKDGTTLFTTHNLEHALSWSNQIAILHAGHVGYTRKTEELELRDLQEVYHEVINSKTKIPKVADVL